MPLIQKGMRCNIIFSEKGVFMEEMIDVLNENTGEKTGEIISKNEAHRTGKWHGSIHVLIVNNERSKTLLQRR